MKTSMNMKLKQSTYAVMTALAVLASPQFAQAGAGWSDNIDKSGAPFKQPTFYANSPMGAVATHGPADLPGTTRDTGTALRKFVDNLPLIDGYVSNPLLVNANTQAVPNRHIPMAVKEQLAAGATGHSVSYPDSDYYEIAVVEYREQLHSDLPPVVKTAATVAGQGPVVTGGTTLRGYVQIWTPNLPASAVKTQLFYLNGAPVLDNKGQVVYMVGDQPHYLGPIIDSQKGTPVRIRFDNYLPTGHYDPITKTRGGDIFLPTDTTIPGSGMGPNGAADATSPRPYDLYTQNRANIYLQGADNPWISDGGPHSWITPAGENTQYPIGVTTQNVPDMASPGAGAQTFYYPNNGSAKMVWYHDYTEGSTRMNVYAGIMSAFMIHDASEATLKAAGGALNGIDEIPLIFEDKTFVPKDVAVEDPKWSTTYWGQYGDLWFPHVYETNQNPDAIDGLNPAGRWDYGPWFWPIFPAPLALPTGEYGHASSTLESIHDTPVINGIAYPNFNAEPKAYRFRLLNASNSRFLNLGLYVASPISVGVATPGVNYAPAAVAAIGTTPAVAGTSVTISADDNGVFPTATVAVTPLAPPEVTMTAGGSGYSAATTVTFSGGGAKTQATGHVVLAAGGVIQGVIIDTTGSGYTVTAANPITVTFTDAVGTGAAATATAGIGGQIAAITLNPPPAGVAAYVYKVNKPTASVVDATGVGSGATLVASANTEVPMVDAVQPAVNPTWGVNTYDGRAGGLPDPAAIGPNIIHIGTEAGFLAQPNIIPSTPVSYQQLRRIVTVFNILDHGLYVGPGENADFVVDFSQFAGKTLIVYNDAPAPDPLLDTRLDYFTGDGDQTSIGGADNTVPGYGPNTRTIMRINVAATQFSGAAAAAPYDPLNNGGPLATQLPAAFAAGQELPLIPQSWQNAAYGVTYNDNVAHIYAGSFQEPTFNYSVGGTAQSIVSFRIDSDGHGYTVAPSVTLVGGLGAGGTAATAHAVLDVAGGRLDSIVIDTPGSGYTSQPTVVLAGGDGLGASASAVMTTAQNVKVYGKGIQELFDPMYGRMNATFSAELPFVSSLIATTIPLGSIDPVTEQIADGETQVWKITHNGVATHQVHFHLMDVQLINRVAWDGTIVALEPAEYGWKQTVKMNPLEDVYVAVRPKSVQLPFGLPQSIHALDPTQPIGSNVGFSQVDPLTGIATTVTNQIYNYDWEYVWNNYLLGNDAIDFRRPVSLNYGTLAPAAVGTVTYAPATQVVSWVDPTPAGATGTLGNKANEQGFLIQRTDTGTFPALPGSMPQSAAMVDLNPTGTTGSTTSIVVPANSTSWTDPTPAASATQYRVLAFNSAGYSPSFIATVAGTGAAGTAAVATSTSAFQPGVPAAPASVSNVVGAYLPTGGFPITVTWTAIAPPKNGFRIVRSGGIDAAGGPVANVTFTIPATTLPVAGVYTYVDVTATELSGYNYTVYADNGTAAAPVLSSGTYTHAYTNYGTPPVISGVSAISSVNGNAVTVSWATPPAITPDPAVTAVNHITGYRITRTVGGVVTTVAQMRQSQNAVSGTITPAANSWTDTAPTLGAASTYTVYGVNGNLTGTVAATGSSATITPAVTTTPGMVGLTATVNSPTQVTLNWAPAPTGTIVTGYQIQRTTAGVTSTIATSTSVATSFVDTTVAQNTTYSYTVVWLNGTSAGLSASVGPVTTAYGAATPVTNLAAVVNATATSVALSWTSGGTSNAYNVARCTNVAGSATCASAYVLLASGITATSYTDATVVANTGYTYEVIAQNGSATNLSSPVTLPVLDIVPPVAPTGVTNTITSGTVTVKWTASTTAAATGYIVQRATGATGTYATIGTVTGLATTTFADTTPVLGTTYLYRVLTVEAITGYPTAAQSVPSAATTAVYNVQNAPTVSATPVFGGVAGAPTVTINWTETALANAPAVTGYQVFRNGVLLATTAATALTYVDTAPTLNTIDTYVVYAANVLGNSLASATVTADVVTQPAPTAVTATVTNGTSATVKWTASVQDAKAPAITAYQVWAVTTSAAGVVSPAVQVGVNTLPTATSLVVPMVVGNTYTFTVRAVNNVGTSVDSTTSATIADSVPTAPTLPTATFSSTTKVTVAWTAATVAANAPAITGYNVYNNGVLVTATPLAATATSYSATTAVGIAYSFTVVAVNASGSSAASTPVVYSDTVPTAPTTLAATFNSATQATLSWTASTVATGAPAITGYNVYNGTTLLTATPLAATATSYVATTASGVAYTYTVKAVNAVGASTASNTFNYSVIVPNAPTALKATPVSGTSVTVSWTASTVPTGGSAVTGYNVYNGTTLLTTTPVTTPSYTATVVPGTAYSFTVQAVNSIGASVSSAALAYNDVAPNTPTAVSAAFTTTTTATVRWTAATLAAGAPAITGYNVYNGTTLLTTTPLAATATSYVATTAVGSSYSFTVVAVNGAGSSTASTAVVYSDTVPTAPAGLTAKGVTATTVNLAWTAATVAAGAPAITAYNVYNGATLVTTTALAANATTYTATVAVGSTYNFTVRAVNAVGATASTAVTYADTVPVAAVAPTFVSAALTTGGTTNDTVVINWTPVANAANAPAVTSYTIEYATTTAGFSATLQSSTSTFQTVTVPAAGLTGTQTATFTTVSRGTPSPAAPTNAANFRVVANSLAGSSAGAALTVARTSLK